MSPSKNKNYAASVRQRLLNYARSNGQDFIFVLRTFAMERLLYRLSRSPYLDFFFRTDTGKTRTSVGRIYADQDNGKST